MAKYALGLHFGTHSVSAVIVDVATGEQASAAQVDYPSGVEGVIVDEEVPDLARQVPGDYRKSMAKCVRAALKKGPKAKRIIGIGVCATGSTPLPIDKDCRPLADQPIFQDEPNAYAWLCKDRTGCAEAEEITRLAAREHPEYLVSCGGAYGSDWFWSKALRCIRQSPEVMDAAASWVELADYIPGLLVGCDSPTELKRSVGAAGHKAMYHADWGLPSAKMLAKLDPKPRLAELRSEKLFEQAHTSDQRAGTLSKKWAGKLGLQPGVPVAVGALDVHAGALGAGIAPGILVKVIGASACDMMVHPNTEPPADIAELSGIVDGSVLPGFLTLEASPAAVGDLLEWFVRYFENGKPRAHKRLAKQAAKLQPGASGLLALDWTSGGRSALHEGQGAGLLLGQTLHTAPAEVYRALIEGIGFGARMIIERFEKAGVSVNKVISCDDMTGNIALVMQIYADASGRRMHVLQAGETRVLGAAILGAVAAGPEAGGYERIEEAQAAMARLEPVAYEPDPSAQSTYDRLFALYRRLRDAFGTPGSSGDMHGVMRDLIALRDRAHSGV